MLSHLSIPFKGKTIIILACAFSFAGCKKLLQVAPPEDQLNTAQVFADDASAMTALSGLYIKIMDNSRDLLNGNISVYTALSSDESGRTSMYPYTYENDFFNNSLSSSNPFCGSLYTTSYYLIYNCNSLLQNLSSSNQISPDTKVQLWGEAIFVRSLLYFYLTNLFGDVPLITGTDYVQNDQLARTDTALVYEHIIADLENVCGILPEAYATTSAYPGVRTRPNRGAAYALLARAYLYTGQWVKAEQAATTVISDPTYQLEKSLDSVFLSRSREAIWQLQPVHEQMATADGRLFLPASGPGGRPTYFIQPWLLNSFEAGDQRLVHWVAVSIINGSRYPYPFKYKLSSDNPPGTEYEMVLRLAEQYLIRAEARAMQGHLSDALADLNVVRHRAGLGNATATTVAATLQLIWHERQVELFTEWGHRWLDLRRTGQINAVLGKEKSHWLAQDALYPLPASELIANPQLTQNPGY